MNYPSLKMETCCHSFWLGCYVTGTSIGSFVLEALCPRDGSLQKMGTSCHRDATSRNGSSQYLACFCRKLFNFIHNQQTQPTPKSHISKIHCKFLIGWKLSTHILVLFYFNLRTIYCIFPVFFFNFSHTTVQYVFSW
jgi:hypothetical protein